MATQTPSRTSVPSRRTSRSTIALKLVMAVSGLVFVVFVLAHMYGNLKAFAGHDSFNAYAEHLRTVGEPILPHAGALWVLRAILIVSLVAHVAAAVVLWRRARHARPVRYVAKQPHASPLSSRTMRWGGVALLLFIVWHLVNFSIGRVNPQGGPTGDPYDLMVDTFQVWWMTLIYLAAMVALGLHLHHGTWSSMQTLGWTNTVRSRHRARAAGWVVALVVAGGFSLTPVFILLGVIS